VTPYPDRVEADADLKAWLEDFSRRFAQTLDHCVRAGATSADRWARRSLQDPEWTPDAMTADAMTAWEELTPLLGRWIDLWLEAAQRPFAGAVPGPVTVKNSPSEPQTLVERRAAEYRELWAEAGTKFRASAYRSEDLLDDWLTLCAKGTRDMTAGAALFWARMVRGD
jgi:hypothetical protein